MLDLLTPTDHATAYEWAAVLLAHAALGLALVAAVAAVLEALAGEWIDDLGGVSWAIVVLAYAVAWEGIIQRLGAGWIDAGADSLAVACGGAFGVFLWQRFPARAAAVAGLLGLALWLGVRVRR